MTQTEIKENTEQRNTIVNELIVEKYIDKLKHELTRYDERYNKRNPYALAHYFHAIDRISKEGKTGLYMRPENYRKMLFNVTTQNFIYENDRFQIPAVEKTVNKFNLNYVRNV